MLFSGMCEHNTKQLNFAPTEVDLVGNSGTCSLQIVCYSTKTKALHDAWTFYYSSHIHGVPQGSVLVSVIFTLFMLIHR